jgi:hypothetical protein
VSYSGTGYTFNLNSLTFNKIVGPVIKKWVPNPNGKSIDITLGGTDMNVTMDANLKALWVIPFDASAVQLKNLTIDFTLESDANKDGVHFILKDSTRITLDDWGVTMKSSVLNKLVEWAHPILKLITGQVMGTI